MPSFEEEAFNRARQIHQNRQTNNPVRSQTGARPHTEPKQTEPPTADNPQPQAQQSVEAAEAGYSATQKQEASLADTLFKNKEQNLILLLLVMLMEENSEPSLLLALIYLLI